MPAGGGIGGNNYGGGGSSHKSTTSDIENVEWNMSNTQPPHVVRYGSGSSQTSQSSGDICRICHCESDLHNPLLTPCYCSGSLKFVHQTCLQQWLTASATNSCELCKFPFIMHTKIKPFNEWKSLEMSGVERRRLFCAVLFHFAAAICVIWSLCVLIERAADEVKHSQIGWPFWTKLVVVTVGLTGGMVFMYIQCRQYLHLCHRWRARNRILLIQNAPEKMHPLQPPSPVLMSRHYMPRSSSGTNSSHGGGPGAGLIDGVRLSGGPAGSGNGAGIIGALHAYDGRSIGHPASGGGGGSSSISSAAMYCPRGHSIVHQPPLPVHCPHCSARDSHSIGSGPASSAFVATGGRPSHGQIIANIENNPLHYERDWQLDDSSQSSFRPCPQGSGSMTPMPFHDSVHTVYDSASNASTTAALQQQASHSSCSAPPPRRSSSSGHSNDGAPDPLALSVAAASADRRTPELTMFKATAGPPSSSAVFLENSDILNDAQYPKLYHRQSAGAVYVDVEQPSAAELRRADSQTSSKGIGAYYQHIARPSQPDEQLHFVSAAEARRYSETRLTQQQQQHTGRHSVASHPATPAAADPIFNVTSVLGPHIPPAGAFTVVDLDANATEILFDDAATDADAAHRRRQQRSTGGDPLEVNIQEMLELDVGMNARRRARHSVHNVGGIAADATDGGSTTPPFVDGRVIVAPLNDGSGGAYAPVSSMFKSLPNLSASCEHLLQK